MPQDEEVRTELEKLYSQIEELLNTNLEDIIPAIIFRPEKL